MKTVETVALVGSMTGTHRDLVVHRYGAPGTGPKVYVQASLHADEIPGMMAAHHLIRRLDDLDRQGRITAEILVVPVANPIGLDQWVIDRPMGRFALSGCGNFNRRFPELAEAAARRVDGRIGPDPTTNVATVREALRACVADIQPVNEAESLRKALLGLAIDADVVLDLHCDDIALGHLYTGTRLWPQAAGLAARLGMPVVLLADDSGGAPFDEACSKPWWLLADRFADRGAIPPACLAATVELRGLVDVDDTLGTADAQGIVAFLADQGAIDIAVPPCPPGPRATPLAGVDMVASPGAGMIAYTVAVGDTVAVGQPVAELIDPLAEDQCHARRPIVSRTAGTVFAIAGHRFVRPGEFIAKVAGEAPLPHRSGPLLTD